MAQKRAPAKSPGKTMPGRKAPAKKALPGPKPAGKKSSKPTSKPGKPSTKKGASGKSTAPKLAPLEGSVETRVVVAEGSLTVETCGIVEELNLVLFVKDEAQRTRALDMIRALGLREILIGPTRRYSSP